MRTRRRMAKEKLSGTIQSSVPNNKIVFEDNSDEGDDHDVTSDEPDRGGGADELGGDGNTTAQQNAEVDVGEDDYDDDDAVEEVSGSAARESSKKLRKAERKIATDTQSRKKRKRKEPKPTPQEGGAEDEDIDDLMMTEDFFKQVDSEQKDEKIKSKREKKERRKMQSAQGKHTTFVVDDEYSMAEAQRKGKNIEVVALGGPVDDADEAASTDDEQELLLSATMGSQPSKTALAFARDKMVGTSMKRSCESRKRRSKDEEGWTRGRAKLGRPGQPAAVFVRR